MDWKLELVIVPVADVDRAKAFYADRVGWNVLVDYAPTPEFRVVQVSPPGSACAVALMRNPGAAGSLQGLHLMVTDIDAARAELADRGVATGGLVHYVDGVEREGPDPQRRDYNSFFTFADPDGNGWMVQERRATPVP